MKIESNNIIPAVTTNAPADKAGAAAGSIPGKPQAETNSYAAPASPQGVPVTMSTQASNMVQARQASVSDVNQQKVDSVRSAIQQGTFKPNPVAIADKMLATAQEMLQQKSR